MEFPEKLLRHRTYLLRALALMLFVANWARFFTASVGELLRLDSLRLCVELRQKWLLKLSGTEGGLTCFKPDATWSTDNCFRRIFLLSLAGLSPKSIDFCLRNRLLALLGWNCCRMVDIFSIFPFAIPIRQNRKVFFPRKTRNKEEKERKAQLNAFMAFYCNPIINFAVVDVRQFLRALCKFL